MNTPSRLLLLVTVVFSCTAKLQAQPEFDREPINYGKTPFDDPITQLQEQLDAGKTQLEYNDAHGYLDAVLEHLEIPPSSQILVKSKTSF